MIKKFFTVVLTVSLLLLIQLPQALAFYKDVPSTHLYYNSIRILYDEGKLPEETENSFKPDNQITQAGLYKLIITYAKVPLSKNISLPYSDTDNSADYAKYLQTAIDLNLIKPPKDKPKFGADTSVAKHNAISILFNALGIGIDYFYNKENFPFKDLNKNSYVAPLAQKAYDLGIQEQDKKDKFKMAKRVTKGEVADYLYKIQQNKKLTNKTITINLGTSNLQATEDQKLLLKEDSFGTFANVWSAIKNDYLYKDNLNNDQLIYDAIKGMLSQVKDEYTIFNDPSENASYMAMLESEYEGIGTVLEFIDGKVVVVSPIKNSPAEKAGIKPADIIKEVDGISVEGKTLEEVAAKIKGKAGTTVKITVQRDSETLTFEITRAKVSFNTVESEVKKWGNKKIGYIELITFGEKSYEEFLEAANTILKEKPDGFIIDLRNNPGGFVDTAINILSLFMTEKKNAVIFEYADSSKTEFKTDGNGLLKGYKIVVIINKGSASASEIVAGALKDYKIAKIIGETSFGKGSAQEVRTYKDKSIFKFTISKWLTPNGTDISKVGITPDKVVSNPNGEDLQLQEALKEF